MNAPQLRNNAYLFDYLVRLGDELKRLDFQEHAAEVLLASKFSTGSPSEFLHEAQAALIQVKTACASQLGDEKATEIQCVIDQIEKAFQDVGGG